jgi:glucosamine-6-phosphate deaminase
VRIATTAPLVLDHHLRVALLGGELVANRLRARPRLRLILPTGHTPLGVYAALRGHAADGSLPVHQATLFQLDEYLGLGPGDERSYAAYLRRELGGVGFGTFHGLNGSAADPDAECARHQALLDEAPIDLVVLGLGRDGHVAFDEPGSPVDAGARRVRLHAPTRGRGRRLRRPRARARGGPHGGAADPAGCA